MASRARRAAFPAAASLRWVVDPIDGTSNFARGAARFCVSLACLEGDTPLIGVIAAPALRETIWAWRGGGAWLNGDAIRAAETTGCQPGNHGGRLVAPAAERGLSETL